MIRCKECGQSREFELTNVGGQIITFTMNELGTVIEKASIIDNSIGETATEEEIIVAVEAAILASSELNMTCSRCKAEENINVLRTAFEDPLEYFESENLCHCGKELWFDKIPGTNIYALICDDEECNWIKRTGAVSGA